MKTYYQTNLNIPTSIRFSKDNLADMIEAVLVTEYELPLEDMEMYVYESLTGVEFIGFPIAREDDEHNDGIETKEGYFAINYCNNKEAVALFRAMEALKS